MIPLLIHFLGFLCVDSAVPPYIGSADAYFLAIWFAAFAAVDLMAIALCRENRLRALLGLSFAWSVSLSVEQAMLMDGLHQADGFMQSLFDLVFFSYFILILARRQADGPVAQSRGFKP